MNEALSLHALHRFFLLLDLSTENIICHWNISSISCTPFVLCNYIYTRSFQQSLANNFLPSQKWSHLWGGIEEPLNNTTTSTVEKCLWCSWMFWDNGYKHVQENMPRSSFGESYCPQLPTPPVGQNTLPCSRVSREERASMHSTEPGKEGGERGQHRGFWVGIPCLGQY